MSFFYIGYMGKLITLQMIKRGKTAEYKLLKTTKNRDYHGNFS